MHHQRKADHLRICLEEQVEPEEVTTGFERYRFLHQALPEVDREVVSLETVFLGRRLRAPLLVSSMTGGTEEAAQINRHLAEAAEELGVAMGVGSQRAAIEDPEWVYTYQVRRWAPNVFLFANLGAVQLNRGYGVEECRRAVEMIEADGLILHLNPLQEALQPQGDTRFAGLLAKIEAVCAALPVPVVVKEVGCGLAPGVVRRLVDAGVAAIDVAGAGGTSWSEVERHRIADPVFRQVAAAFAGWGIPTAEALRLARQVAPDVPLIASGGIRTGIDVAKALALGADLAGLALPLLRPATVSTQAVVDALTVVMETLRTAMFCLGVSTLEALRGTPHLVRVE